MQPEPTASSVPTHLPSIVPTVAPAAAPIPPEKQRTPEPAHSTAMGRFVYNHRGLTKNPAGFLGYQVVRNMLAAIPYGLASTVVWEGFERVIRKTAGARRNSVGFGINSLAKSPIQDVAMVAAGYTVYRATLKLVRVMKEHLFNPDYTPQQAQQAVDTAGKKAVTTLREIMPAEVNSTPFGAVALGLGRRCVDIYADHRNRAPQDKIALAPLGKPELGQQRLLRFTKEGKFAPHLTDSKEFWHKIAGKGSGIWIAAGIQILAFLPFFEVSDRLYKDAQIRRGKWRGEHNALANPSPEQDAATKSQEAATGKDKDADYQQHKYAGKHPEIFGTGDPSPLRLIFTRVLPTAIGIGAYTFTKRAAYLAMGHSSAKNTFWKRAFVEGAATSTFFVMTATGDVFEMLWKKMTEPKHQQPLTPHQEQKYTELLDRVNAKDAQLGRTA